MQIYANQMGLWDFKINYDNIQGMLIWIET